MKTAIYWAVQHLRHAVRDGRFIMTCWWLRQQVEFLDWRLRLEALMPQARAEPLSLLSERNGRYVVRAV